jgi:D-sedoheptulose 7-phosphate isomerase
MLGGIAEKPEEKAMIEFVEHSLREAQDALQRLIANRQTLEQITRAADLLCTSLEQRGHVYSCGNGGSMCDAMHFAEELTGRYRMNRPPLGAVAISDVSHMSCVSNDLSYEEVFSRYLEAHGRSGDCLVALSTSGTSKNVIRAAQMARSLDMRVIILSGRPSPVLEALSDVYLCTPGAQFADRVQELHIKVLHILIELIERRMFPANYASNPA